MIATQRVSAFCLTLTALAGCGLKAPLYLPPPEAPAVEQPPSDATAKPKPASLKKAQGQQQPGPQAAPAPMPTPEAAGQLDPASAPGQ